MIYKRVKATFAYAKDSLWRSLYVRGDITLEEFGCALLVSLRAAFEHTFQFDNKDKWFVPESFGDFSSSWTPMRGHTLDELGDEFDFEYDTGDGWDFHCKVYKRTKEIDSDRKAIFEDGAGLGIWEDGISSFYMAVTGQVRPNRTKDKEEIGSVGNTGLNSNYVHDYIAYLAENQGADVKEVLANSACLSADVNAAYDPTFPDVFEKKNASFLNHGVVLTKYTGARGKSGSSDASAEFMAKVIDIMDRAKVYWQIGELGAVDAGGGGTIAQFVAMMNIDVVDLGVPVLSMHAPFEITSKLDLYNTYLAFRAFYNEAEKTPEKTAVKRGRRKQK